MSIHVTDFKWKKGKNDLRYIELLEKTLKNEQAITAKAVAKIRELSKENKENRNKAINEFAERLKAEHEGLITNLGKPYAITFEKIDEVTEEMRGVVE